MLNHRIFFIGYHNYHHSYPNDYQASEHGHGFNLTKHFIDLMAKFGFAYNLRTMSDTTVDLCKQRQMTANNETDDICKQKTSKAKFNSYKMIGLFFLWCYYYAYTTFGLETDRYHAAKSSSAIL